MPDLTTLLSKFLNDLYTGTLGTSVPISKIGVGDGTVGLPSLSFVNDPDTGFWLGGPNQINVALAGANAAFFAAGAFTFPGTIYIGTAQDVSLIRVAANVLSLRTGTSAQAFRIYQDGTIYNELNATLPTISSGFGASPSIVAGGTAMSFRVNVGTGGAATSGVIGMPTMPTGWNAIVQDMTTNIATRVTASTTNTITITAASAWTSSDILVVHAIGY